MQRKFVLLLSQFLQLATIRQRALDRVIESIALTGTRLAQRKSWNPPVLLRIHANSHVMASIE